MHLARTLAFRFLVTPRDDGCRGHVEMANISSMEPYEKG
jgi:hypothetical protein